MNKIYWFMGIGLAFLVIILLMFFLTSPSSSMTLDEIIKNNDCNALVQWEKEHMFDEPLNISSKQIFDATNLAMMCPDAVFYDMFDNIEIPTSKIFDDNAEMSLDDILEIKYCIGIDSWINENGYGTDLGTSSEQLSDVLDLKLECDSKLVDEFGYLILPP